MESIERSGELGAVILDRLPPLVAAAERLDQHQVLIALRRLVASIREVVPALAESLNKRLAAERPGSPGIRRLSHAGAGPRTSAPLDPDTNVPLVRAIAQLDDLSPVLPREVEVLLEAFVAEQEASDRLLRAGLLPRSTLLLSGPPGVGKTMLARWLGARLKLEVVQIELASIVSSYLGRTGQNLKEVLDHARTARMVLLLDEFDAVAKRRDDHTDLGELKRIVSVLLKELEEWPGPSIIIAATNHEELIDPAIFRRFQVAIRLSPPDAARATQILELHLGPEKISSPLLTLGGDLLDGTNGSYIRDLAHAVRREVLLGSVAPEPALLQKLAEHCTTTAQRKRFCELARVRLPESARSYSRLAEMLHVSKSTIADYMKREEG